MHFGDPTYIKVETSEKHEGTDKRMIKDGILKFVFIYEMYRETLHH
jgi:hypothetical protein